MSKRKQELQQLGPEAQAVAHLTEPNAVALSDALRPTPTSESDGYAGGLSN